LVLFFKKELLPFLALAQRVATAQISSAAGSAAKAGQIVADIAAAGSAQHCAPA